MFTSFRRRAALPPIVMAFTASCASAGPTYDSLRAELDRAGPVAPQAAADSERTLSASVLNRAAFVGAVLERNPSLDEARSAWRIAVARVRQAGVLDDPMVNLGLAPLSIASSSAPVGYTVEVSQRLPWPGKLAFEDAAARAEAAAARADFVAARLELALSASLLYDRYFVAVRSMEINREHVALMTELKAAAVAQFESGRGSAQDPLQAEAELAHLEHDAMVFEADRDITIAQMNELLHREPTVALPPPVMELEVPPTGPEAASLASSEQDAVAQGPEIEAARLRAQAGGAHVRRAEREWYPDFTVSTTYDSMWPTPEHRWSVGIGINLPIQLGRRGGAIDEAAATRARFESTVASLTDEARMGVVVAIARLREAHHVRDLYEHRLVPIARDQVDAARAGFIASRNDFVAVIGAEKNLRDAQLSYEMARANVGRRQAEFERALGRVPGLDDKDTGR